MTYNIIWEWDTARVYEIKDKNIVLKVFKKDYPNTQNEISNYHNFSLLLEIFTLEFPNHKLRIPKIILAKDNYIFMERIYGYNINSIIILKELLLKNTKFTVWISDYSLFHNALKIYQEDRKNLHKKITSHYVDYFYNNSEITNSLLFDFHRYLLKKWLKTLDFTPKNIMIDNNWYICIIDFWLLKNKC